MSFIENFLTYSSSNEAPAIYHRWAALSALSHLIGPRVWTHMGGSLYFYPNMYIILAGDPGIMKTTAMRGAQKIVESVKDISVSPASASKEAIVKLMAKKDSPCKRSYSYKKKVFLATGDEALKDEVVHYSQLAIFGSEIVSLLNASGNPNVMIEFLTDIWDRVGSNYHELFKTAGESNIERPYISILACLTPSTLKSMLTSKVLTSGMSRRCIFPFADSNGAPIPFISVTLEQEQAWEKCIEHGKMLQAVKGPFDWTDDARFTYINWYEPFKKNVKNARNDTLKLFYMSKAEYVIKISMLLSLAQEPPLLQHTKPLFLSALEFVTEVEEGACRLFDASGRNELASITTDVERYIEERGTVNLVDLKVKFWKELKDGNVLELEKITEHLIRCNKLDCTMTVSQGVTLKNFTWKKPH